MLRLIVLLLICAGLIAADRSGTYVGTYSSTEGDSAGNLRIVIQKNHDGSWLCQVFFTPEADEIATKPGSCSVDNGKIATEFDVDVEGTTVHAALKGTAPDEKSFQGTYTTTGGSGGDRGTWKAALRP